MARDAQLAGDRVQTEYYLQFADHYFRVLGESRSRFEEQRRQRGDDMDEEDGDEEFVEAAETETGDNDDRSDRQERQERQDRPERGPHPNRRDREPRRFNRDDRAANEGGGEERMNGSEGSLPLDVLPPAIGADEGSSDEAPAPRPRRRTRGPRPAEGEDDIAPAA